VADANPPLAAASVYRPWLDGLRGIAVLLVVAEHVGQVAGFGLPAGLGETGVGIFFGLSGYLITGLLLDEQARSGKIRFRAFYLRRAARLLPALVVMLGVSCAVLVRLGYPEVIRDALYTLFYLANYRTVLQGEYMLGFGQAWSLAVEEHFYLMWPLALMFLARRRSAASLVRWIVIACAVVLMWRCVLVLLHGPELLIYHGSIERLDALLYGCAGAVGMRAGWRPSRWLSWFAIAALVTAVIVGDRGVLGMTLVQAMVGLSSAVLVIGLDAHPSKLRRTLSVPPIVWTGLVSYGIYLWHWPILIVSVLHFDERNVVITALLGFVLTPAVAAASYYCFERPIRTVVRDWIARRDSRQSTCEQVVAAE
jgi:peptidoglycan/LPS O-acetylase OafA/YrhL